MNLPKLLTLPAGETINGRKMFAAGDLRDYARAYGQQCTSYCRATCHAPIPTDGKYSSAVNDLMGMMGMTK